MSLIFPRAPRFAASVLVVLAVIASTPQAALAGGPRALAESLDDPALARVLDEILERNPELARERARATAAELRAPQVATLPDPMAALTLFLLPPETRVGPQRLSVQISQKVPFFGKLELRERAALLAAASARARVEAQALELLTAARRHAIELAFLDLREEIVREEKEHLIRHEEAARARYVAGMGLQQEVVKIQAAITREDERLLGVAARRSTLQAELNALRDRPADHPLDAFELPEPEPLELELDTLRSRALGHRPELAAAAAELARAQTLVELAEKNFKPDFTFGLGYTVVEPRGDAAGLANPPSGNGDDVVALQTAVELPVRKRRLEAGLEEALALESAAAADERAHRSAIERSLGEPAARLPLVYDQWRLLSGVLLAQAEEALASAEAAYTTGELGALDLRDAEHVLFEVRTAAERSRADHALALAELEGALAGPLEQAVPSPEDLSP